MTTLFDTPQSDTAGAAPVAKGRVVRVIGPVVDIEFSRDNIPAVQRADRADRTR